MKRIVANVMAEEIRMVVLDEQNELVDTAFYRPTRDETINHIYKGVVRNVLPGMSAAFVDIGLKQNAYLNLKQGKQTKAMGKLFVGQNVLVQVVKEEMLGKGARVSADVSLASRFMVLLPYSEGLHISKRITDDILRAQLADMAAPYLANGCGFILRTAAAEATAEELQGDMEFLWRTWHQLQNRYKVAKGGTELYSDADFWFRVIREYLGHDVNEIIVDDQGAYERLQELLSITNMADAVTLRQHTAAEPIFKEWQVESQLDTLLNSTVELPSGGFLKIDTTEALTVIDVNSGHFTGRSGTAGEVALEVNREAARMIARQLRLRDIGGIIVCDFIDLPKKAQRDELLAYLTQLVHEDRVKTVVCGITSLGLVEITRKRERQGLQSILFDTCSQCGGTGQLFSAETVYLQIIRRLRELYRAGRLKSNVLIEVNDEVKQYFTKSVVSALEEECKRTIKVEMQPSMSREAYSLLALGDD